jgi:hypothetical protein
MSACEIRVSKSQLSASLPAMNFLTLCILFHNFGFEGAKAVTLQEWFHRFCIRHDVASEQDILVSASSR